MYHKRKNWKASTKYMKPRIFVSSTFYDLKYIREDLSSFIKAHDFESIMFEDGDIGYTPGRALDESCYEMMRSADMVILVIGGLYGSPATGEEKDGFREYMSVTRNEFRTAVNEGIPIYAFIDAKVYSEYAIYEMNVREIEEKNVNIRFSATKDINIFRFIKEIKSIGNIVITEFTKLTQIKEFLSKQWSDMFKKYLDILKEEKNEKKLVTAVDEMKLLINKMDTMLDSIGKKVLGESENVKYSDVVEEIEISRICDILSDKLTVGEFVSGDRQGNVEKFLSVIMELISNQAIREKDFGKEKEFDDYMFEVYHTHISKYGAQNCSMDHGIAADLSDLEKIKQENVYNKVKNKLLEEKYYRKIFNINKE